MVLDVSADRLERTLDLVTEANGILSSSFDVTQTLPALAQLCVPALAEYCAVHVLPVEGVHVQPAVITSGNLDIGEAGSSAEFEMSVGNKQFGTMTFAARRPDAFDHIDHKIFTLFAMRAAIALHTVTSFSREHRVADRLQRALLPESFPPVEGLSFGGAYRPASSEAEVGGDWYDAFALPDGRIAISIGDVAGHGLEAAVIMGEVRQALRAAAIGSDRPSAVLEAVNGVINLRESVSMVTAVFAFYDPQRATLRYAVAGHPPPIIATPEGFAHVLPGGGLPLGAASRVESPDWTFTMPPGSQVVLYTDGLIEYDRNIELGEQRLIEAISDDLAAAESANPAKGIQDRIFSQAPNKDDAATLTLTRSDATATDVSLVFSAIPLVSALVRSTLRRLSALLHLNSDAEFALLVAVGEAIANAVEHAYGTTEPGLVEITTRTSPERFTVQIDDFGRWRPFQKRSERGHGIPLMHALVDGVQIKSTQATTSITLSIDLKPEAEAPTMQAPPAGLKQH